MLAIDGNVDVRREVCLGDSKLDFLVHNTYIEVKTPLQYLQIDIPNHVRRMKSSPFTATDRIIRHFNQLGNSLRYNERAIMLICFLYDNPGFEVVEKHKSMNYEMVRMTIDNNIAKGVENWQANFKITDEYVVLEKYFQLHEIKD